MLCLFRRHPRLSFQKCYWLLSFSLSCANDSDTIQRNRQQPAATSIIFSRPLNESDDEVPMDPKVCIIIYIFYIHEHILFHLFLIIVFCWKNKQFIGNNPFDMPEIPFWKMFRLNQHPRTDEYSRRSRRCWFRAIYPKPWLITRGTHMFCLNIFFTGYTGNSDEFWKMHSIFERKSSLVRFICA